MIRFRVILSIILLFSIGELLAENISSNGSKSSLSQVTPPAGSVYYLGSGMWFDIGKYHYNNNNSNYINRTVLDFSLSSIPSNATITTVNLIYAVNSNDFLTTHFFRVTEFAGGSGPEAAWRNVGESATLFTNVAYGNGTLNSTRLKTMVEQNKGNSLKLGVVAANESDLACGAIINFTIYVSFTVPPANINIFATNNFFTSGNVQGQIIADGIGNAPKQIARLVGSTATFQGIDNQVDVNDYQRVWVAGSRWTKYISDGSEQQISNNTNISYTTDPLTLADARATYKANFKRMCNVTVVRNNQYGGIVKIFLNGQQYPALPSVGLTKSVVEGDPITLSAENETVYYVDYNFQGWLNNATNLIESTDLQYTVNPEEHKNYTAIFKGYAQVNMLMTQDNGNSVGQNPTITWTDNPNTNVYYRVYRSPGLNGETWALASTVQKGVQTFNDGYHIITGSKEGDFCALRLEAVYSPDNTEVLADNVYFNTEEVAWKATANNRTDAAITKYAIANYPNPFNPTTVINYQVPDAGHVTVKVYDVMGKEIATLVDGAKNKGSYNINFSMDQYHLSSGIYFCRMQAGKNITTTKMILSK